MSRQLPAPARTSAWLHSWLRCVGGLMCYCNRCGTVQTVIWKAPNFHIKSLVGVFLCLAWILFSSSTNDIFQNWAKDGFFFFVLFKLMRLNAFLSNWMSVFFKNQYKKGWVIKNTELFMPWSLRDRGLKLLQTWWNHPEIKPSVLPNASMLNPRGLEFSF